MGAALALSGLLLGATACNEEEKPPAGQLSEQAQKGLEVAPFQIDVTGLSLADKELLGRGSYLVNSIGGCVDCHNTKDVSVTDTGTYRTGLGVPVEKFVTPGVTRRIDPGNPQGSCVYHRMTIRGTEQQMPPTASRITDPDGLAVISAWISSLR